MTADEIRQIVREELGQPVFGTIRDRAGRPIGLKLLATGESVYLTGDPKDALPLASAEPNLDHERVTEVVCVATLKQRIEALGASLPCVAHRLVDLCLKRSHRLLLRRKCRA